jgi:F0F1-type ATP synthase assembly protein I
MSNEKKKKPGLPLGVKMALGTLLGALVGWSMYRFVGCRTGTCPLTGNLYVSVLIWAGMGALLAGNPDRR